LIALISNAHRVHPSFTPLEKRGERKSEPSARWHCTERPEVIRINPTQALHIYAKPEALHIQPASSDCAMCAAALG
jgi:hypothetical protein